jgi:hypothetical protein
MSESIEPGMPRRPVEQIREGRLPNDPPLSFGSRPEDFDLRKPESYLPAFVAAILVLVAMTLFILFFMFVQWVA